MCEKRARKGQPGTCQEGGMELSNDPEARKWQERILAMGREMRENDLSLYLGREPGHIRQTPFTLEDLGTIRNLFGSRGAGGRLFHLAADAYLRTRVEPLQNVLNSLMNGARAQVTGEDIAFADIIGWCQACPENEKRRLLAREVRALCRFLAPFNLSTWQALDFSVREELGYPDYLSYCREKKEIDLAAARQEAASYLAETAKIYRSRTADLLAEVTGLSLEKASRYDAIYLLGLRYLDHLYPRDFTEAGAMAFFERWNLDLGMEKGLHLHVSGRKGRQSYCVPVSIPGEIHVVTGPLAGWLDLEALFHELGHALGFILVDPCLPEVERELGHSLSRSETSAFLLQRTCMSRPFLHRVMGLSESLADEVARIHGIKWLALARRYAAKLIIEVDNFQQRGLEEGGEYYARTMSRETGFTYGEEAYLFDLMPDFYTFDYFAAFMEVERLWQSLLDWGGEEWFLRGDAGERLRKWWQADRRSAG